jgi:hypothetical protein
MIHHVQLVMIATALEYHLIQKGYHSITIIPEKVACVGSACDGRGHGHGRGDLLYIRTRNMR